MPNPCQYAIQVCVAGLYRQQSVRFEPECTGTPFRFFFWRPERRAGPFQFKAAGLMNHLILAEYKVAGWRVCLLIQAK